MAELRELDGNGLYNTDVKSIGKYVLNCSPTLSFSFENLYLEQLGKSETKSVQEDRQHIDSHVVPPDSDPGDPGRKPSHLYFQSREGKYSMKCGQKSLRLVEGRLQTVGFKIHLQTKWRLLEERCRFDVSMNRFIS